MCLSTEILILTLQNKFDLPKELKRIKNLILLKSLRKSDIRIKTYLPNVIQY